MHRERHVQFGLRGAFEDAKQLEFYVDRSEESIHQRDDRRQSQNRLLERTSPTAGSFIRLL